MAGGYLNPYNNYHGREPIPPIEMEKYHLTERMDNARSRGDYREVIRLAQELARICRSQGKESDAYLLDHEAFRYNQKLIYQEADVSVWAFDDVPYVEKLKDAMTKAADQAIENKQIDYAVCYKRLIARLCKAQGQGRNVEILECGIRPMLEQAKMMQQQRGLTDAELESLCLQRIAQKYGTRLSED